MEPWLRVLILSAGGALGVNARYWLTTALAPVAGPRFPWATVAINVSGSFAAGFLASALAAKLPHPYFRLFFVVGFLGGFTTFSAFSLESLALWERGTPRLTMANMVGSVAVGFVAVVLGAALARGEFPGHRPVADGPNAPATAEGPTRKRP